MKMQQVVAEAMARSKSYTQWSFGVTPLPSSLLSSNDGSCPPIPSGTPSCFGGTDLTLPHRGCSLLGDHFERSGVVYLRRPSLAESLVPASTLGGETVPLEVRPVAFLGSHCLSRPSDGEAGEADRDTCMSGHRIASDHLVALSVRAAWSQDWKSRPSHERRSAARRTKSERDSEGASCSMAMAMGSDSWRR